MIIVSYSVQKELIHYFANDLNKLFVAACFDYVIDLAFIVSHATENLDFCLFVANSSQKIGLRRSFKREKFLFQISDFWFNLTLKFLIGMLKLYAAFISEITELLQT